MAMRDWRFWDWTAYGCLAVATSAEALEAGLKQAPHLATHMPDIVTGELWGFVPFGFLLLGTAILLLRAWKNSHSSAKSSGQTVIMPRNDAQHRKDFRWTWGGLIAGFLVLAGLFIYGYNRLDDRIDVKTTSLVISITRVETKLDDLSGRLLPPPAPPRR